MMLILAILASLYLLSLSAAHDVSSVFVPSVWTPSPVDVAWSTTQEQTVVKKAAALTLAQKARMLDMYTADECCLTNGVLDEVKINATVGSTGILSMVHDFYPLTANWTNRIQEIVMSRSGIPVLFIEECLHGYQQSAHTSFNGPLGFAASFRPDNLERAAQVIATEAHAFGVRMCLAPVLGVGREQRWGRVEEGFGEDTWLISAFAQAFVYGLSGRMTGNKTVIAEPKHFAAHAVPQAGINTAPSRVGLREMEDSHLPPFRASIEAGSLSVMSAYSEYDGIPCSGSQYLLTQKLRTEWGFKGFVLSDLGAVDLLWSRHKVAATPEDAVRLYLNSGGNSQFYDFDHNVYQNSIINGVTSGSLSIDVLNSRVTDMLRVRSLLKLDTEPYVNPTLAETVVRTPASQLVSLKAALDSIVLLKNNPVATSSALHINNIAQPILPLQPWLDSGKIKNIAVIGVLADQIQYGDYAGPGNYLNAIEESTLLLSLTQQLNSRSPYASITYTAGVDVFNQPGLQPITRQHFYAGLEASYWTNINFTGPSTLNRTEPQLNNQFYHYGFSSNYPSAEFSARYTGTVIWPSTAQGRLGINAGGQGAVRLYLDNHLIIDGFNKVGSCQPCAIDYSFVVNERHTVQIDYFQTGNDQALVFSYDLVGNDNEAAIQRAVNTVANSDVAIIVVGDNADSSGEGHDRVSLDLSGQQGKLITTIAAATTAPLIVILHSGRAPTIPDMVNDVRVSAIVEAFTIGQEGGPALVSTLLGDNNPAGRLPMTYPKNVGQLPLFYNAKGDGAPGSYVDSDSAPVFWFGHGLSYSNFTYSNLLIFPTQVRANGLLNVSFTITNVQMYGQYVDGEEVAQLYLHDIVASTTTPVKQLRGFARVEVPAASSVQVTIQVNVTRACQLVNNAMQWVVEPGVFNVMVGGSSDRIALTGSFSVTLSAEEELERERLLQSQREYNQQVLAQDYSDWQFLTSNDASEGMNIVIEAD